MRRSILYMSPVGAYLRALMRPRFRRELLPGLPLPAVIPAVEHCGVFVFLDHRVGADAEEGNSGRVDWVVPGLLKQGFFVARHVESGALPFLNFRFHNSIFSDKS